MEQSSNTDTRNIVDAEPSQSHAVVAEGKDSHASGNESFLFRMKGKVQKETECYTIKQVDDYLATTGLSGFALESERNRLIERLKARLKVINEPDSNVLPSDARVDALFDIGFSKYEKACILLENAPVRCPPAELKEKFCKMVEHLLDSVPGVHLPKFVFSEDDIEFHFHGQYGIHFGFVTYYRFPSTTCAMASFHYTGHEPNLQVNPIGDCDIKKALEFIEYMTPVRLLLGSLERINPYLL